MPHIWIALFLFIGMTWPDRAVAQSSCNTDRIRTQLQASETFPDLRGCRPDNVRQLLQNHDYGLEIENRVESRTYREGRIVSQRVDDGYVFVDVSSGPGPQRDRDTLINVLEGVGRVIASLPPPSQPPPAAEPIPQQRPPAPAPDQLTNVITGRPAAMQPAPPAQRPSPEPTPSPPAVVTTVATPTPPAPAGEERVTRAPERPPEPAPAPPPADPAPPPAPTIDPETLQTGPGIPPPAVPEPQKPVEVIPPPVAASRFSIEISPSVREGDELLLTIRREGRDEISHRLQLAYSDPSLLISPQPTFEFDATMPDEVTLQLRTVVTDDDGDRQLIVRLASADAEVRQPDSVTALILHRTSWWEELLQTLAAVPVWALALAGTAAAAGLGLYLMPRATCSIEGGSPGWGARRPRSGWPEAHAEVVMGKPLFSVPSPLPIRRREDVQPSPT